LIFHRMLIPDPCVAVHYHKMDQRTVRRTHTDDGTASQTKNLSALLPAVTFGADRAPPDNP